ncbi:MAG TPA: LOG family protein [Planctomycetota bacterium]|nr:LOG family protein [Planctomycetota bacterium]HRR78736.1 LOG family protein [Planctomycetota bacterium]HRT95680.1 LOG family protein [Planctomycetota bacterium]
MPRIITVFGASSARPGSAEYDEALRLGRLLAQAGFAVCNGGYGGTMEASARGAREAGGHTIGITNALFDPRAANRYIADERKAPDFYERLRRLLELGEAYVCLRGSVGTLTEFALAWTLLQTGSLSPRPFICVGPAWRAVLDAYRAHLPVRPKDLALITLADTVEDAVSVIRGTLPCPSVL